MVSMVFAHFLKISELVRWNCQLAWYPLKQVDYLGSFVALRDMFTLACLVV